jgi:Uma2 family endonuclease
MVDTRPRRTEYTPVRRLFTVDEYERMGQRGILHEDDRVELIEGEIVCMAPIGSRHFRAVNDLNRWLVVGLDEGLGIVSPQNSVRLERSEPQPDLAVYRPRADGYFNRLPGPADALLIVEVADTTFRYDQRTKLPIYARAGVPEYWIVDVDRRRIHVYRRPEGDGYLDHNVVRPGEPLAPAAFPDLVLDTAHLFR